MNKVFHDLYATWNLDAQWQLWFSWGAALISIVVLSYLLSWLIRGAIGSFIRGLAKRTDTKWDDHLFDKKFFDRLGNFLPAVAGYLLLVSLVTPDATVFPFLRKLLMILVCVAGTSFVDQLVTNWERGFLTLLGDRKVPIRSYVQVAKILLFLVSGILIFAVLLDQNPLVVLTGLGALTAVLLLVFKDSLLGFVASLQVNSNDLVTVGDWIEFPGQNIDGEVVDIALSVIKIRSGDNTIFSLPTYNLVSTPFKNWRNVKKLGARRIKVSFPIDILSHALVGEKLEKKLRTRGFWKVAPGEPAVSNTEAFRQWAQAFLESHPDVLPEMSRVVRLGDPVGRGLPVEMIFFTQLTDFPEWEQLHSQLLCHALSMLAEFELRAFQEPTSIP